MKIAFQMEDMAVSSRTGTNSLVLIQEANRRGYEVFHYNPLSLSIDGDGVRADTAPVSVDMSKDEYFKLGAYRTADLKDMDVIFMRQRPPFDMRYISYSYMLDRLKDEGVYITNDPTGVRDTPEKLAIFEFPQYIAPTIVTADHKQVRGFFDTHQDIIIKPLYLFFGKGITRSKDYQEAISVIEELNEPVMLQKFLPDVFDGNKRIVLFDGEIISAMKTVSGDGAFITHQSYIDTAYDLTDYEIEMCATISAGLKGRRLDFVAVDIIGSYLTEINVTCPGSLMRLDALHDMDHSALLWDVIERKQAAFVKNR